MHRPRAWANPNASVQPEMDVVRGTCPLKSPKSKAGSRHVAEAKREARPFHHGRRAQPATGRVMESRAYAGAGSTLKETLKAWHVLFRRRHRVCARIPVRPSFRFRPAVQSLLGGLGVMLKRPFLGLLLLAAATFACDRAFGADHREACPTTRPPDPPFVPPPPYPTDMGSTVCNVTDESTGAMPMPSAGLCST